MPIKDKDKRNEYMRNYRSTSKKYKLTIPNGEFVLAEMTDYQLRVVSGILVHAEGSVKIEEVKSE